MTEPQARYAGAPWTDTLPDNCTCHWVNYSDSTGWFLKSQDENCPVHGWSGTGPPDGNSPLTGIAWNE